MFKPKVTIVTIGFDREWEKYLEDSIAKNITKVTWSFHHFSELSSEKFETKNQVLLIVYCPAVMDGQNLGLLQQVLKANVGQLWPTILFLDDSTRSQLDERVQEVI